MSADMVTAAALAAVITGEGERQYVLRCAKGHRLAGTWIVRGVPVWVTFGRGDPQAFLACPTGRLEVRCRCGDNMVEFLVPHPAEEKT